MILPVPRPDRQSGLLQALGKPQGLSPSALRLPSSQALSYRRLRIEWLELAPLETRRVG